MYSLSKQIIADMWTHRLRSVLALFGIFWGTLTVVLLLAVGSGFHQASQKNLMRLVDGTFFIVPGVRSKSFQGLPKGSRINVKSKDIVRLPEIVPNIDAAVPSMQNRMHLHYGKQRANAFVVGTSPDFKWLRKINLTAGSRFINPMDVTQGRLVVILGSRLKERLFGNKNAIGEKMVVTKNAASQSGAEFTVVGVIQPPENNIYNDNDRNAIIPYSAYINLWGDQNIMYFSLFPNPAVDSENVKNNVLNYLSHQFHFDRSDTDAMNVFDSTKMFQFFTWFFMGIQIFLGICGGLTLGVGSLGVANIMFLIVTERTREIGLRMAVGATEKNIMTQILLEGFVMIFIGALLGFLTAFFIVEILQYVPLPAFLGKPMMSMISVVVTIIVIAALGLMAGFFPAKRAAKMDPVEALGF